MPKISNKEIIKDLVETLQSIAYDDEDIGVDPKKQHEEIIQGMVEKAKNVLIKYNFPTN